MGGTETIWSLHKDKVYALKCSINKACNRGETGRFINCCPSKTFKAKHKNYSTKTAVPINIREFRSWRQCSCVEGVVHGSWSPAHVLLWHRLFCKVVQHGNSFFFFFFFNIFLWWSISDICRNNFPSLFTIEKVLAKCLAEMLQTWWRCSHSEFPVEMTPSNNEGLLIYFQAKMVGTGEG